MFVYTHTYTGREIAKFMAAVQAAVYGSAKPILTPQVWDTVLKRKLFEHQERSAFRCVCVSVYLCVCVAA